MKKILITNDDGFEAPGLKALIKALKPLGRVIVVAPSSEKSACGHSITLTRPLRFITIDDDFYKLDDGTPSDCIYLSLHTLFDTKPDLIISGINKGANMGEDITYSGTASAAMEGALHNIPSIAISQVLKGFEKGYDKIDYSLASKTAFEISKMVLDKKIDIPHRNFLNINIPPIKVKNEFKGYKITKAGYRLYGNDAHRHTNPRGEEYFWLGLHPLEWDENKLKDDGIMSDFEAINNKFVSITPIKLDLTSYEAIPKMQTAFSR